MKVVAVCPRCGHRFFVEVNMEKGKGAHYGRRIRRLGRLHRLILGILGEHPEGLTKRQISRILYQHGYYYSGNSISGRLSELLGLGYVRVEKMRVELFDKEEQRWRPVTKPVWFLTETGRKAIRGVEA